MGTRIEHYIERLIHTGTAAASMAGLQCVVERSPSSESVYFHTRHGEVWRGVRVSCHAPAYACSADYEQLLVSRSTTSEELPAYLQRLRHRVRYGGRVIANPAEVRSAIERLESLLLDGHRYVDRMGVVWRWSSSQRRWRADADALLPPPAHLPAPPVTNRVASSIRHTLNTQAVWRLEGGERTEGHSSDTGGLRRTTAEC